MRTLGVLSGACLGGSALALAVYWWRIEWERWPWI
jgi:hypothetical protein